MSSTWQLLTDMSSPAQSAARESIRQLVKQHPDATLDHDLDWLQLRANGRDRTALAFVLQNDDGEVIGYAPFLVHPSSFSFEYAARTFLEIKTRRHAINAQPLLLRSAANVETVAQLLLSLRAKCVGPDVLFGLGVPLESVFAHALKSPEIAARFVLMSHGPEYSRRLLRLPENLEAYLALLGSKTRQDLRRQERRLSKEASDAVRVTVHATEETVADFVQHSAEVSQRTYQWRLHHMGITNDAGTLQHYCAIAAQGWLRCYVLHAQDVPIAFMVGYLYRGVYYSETIGYDPKWAEYSVGNVLHLHVVRDLTALNGAVQWFDFLYGDNSNKERLSTHSHREANFYLIPRTFRWVAIITALRGFDAATGWFNRLLTRHGVKEKLKRWLRRRATDTQTETKVG